MMATRAPKAADVKGAQNEVVAPGARAAELELSSTKSAASGPNDLPPEAGQCSETCVLDGNGVGLAIPREKVRPLITHPLIRRQGASAVENSDFLGICW